MGVGNLVKRVPSNVSGADDTNIALCLPENWGMRIFIIFLSKNTGESAFLLIKIVIFAPCKRDAANMRLVCYPRWRCWKSN